MMTLTNTLETAEAPKRLVVIGAGGFVGSTLADQATDADLDVLRVTRAEVDLLQPDAGERLRAMLKEGDAVVAASAIAPVKSMSMLRDNLLLIEHLAQAIKGLPLAHVVNVGSDAVFADSDEPLTEQSCRAPSSLHGIMHLTREVVLEEATGSVPFATLRPTLIYGLADPHNGYGPNRFRRLVEAGKDIVLFGEGEERRDHVSVDDVAELLLRTVLHRSTGGLNVATGEVISFRELAELAASLGDGRSQVSGSPRTAPMPHNGLRRFDARATSRAFPDFEYTLPEDGVRRLGAPR